MVERKTFNLVVVGSSPTVGAFFVFHFCFQRSKIQARKKEKDASAGNQTRVWPVAGAYSITELPTLTVFVPRIELGTSRVLGGRHNQLDHTNVVEYLGFDPSTSTLLRSHASDCANTPKRTCKEDYRSQCLVRKPLCNTQGYLHQSTRPA